MSALIPVDRLEMQVIVDNVTDGLSSTLAFVEGEMSYLWRSRRIKEMSGKGLASAAHGLSCILTAWRGTERRTVLFDAGPEDDVFERNVTRLGIDLAPVDACVLSHGHWDHAGAFPRAFEMMRRLVAPRRIPLYMHPGMFRSRAQRHVDGTMRPMEDVPSVAALESLGATVVSTREPAPIAGGTFWVSGEIPRVTAYEQGLPGQHRRTEDDSGWEPDPLLMDERFLAVHVSGKGLVVFSACSHAGIVNVLTEARARFPEIPIYAAFGGLHLSGTNERIIPDTVRDLGQFKLGLLGAGHCTGWRAMSRLYEAYGDGVLAPLSVGKRYVIGAG